VPVQIAAIGKRLVRLEAESNQGATMKAAVIVDLVVGGKSSAWGTLTLAFGAMGNQKAAPEPELAAARGALPLALAAELRELQGQPVGLRNIQKNAFRIPQSCFLGKLRSSC